MFYNVRTIIKKGVSPVTEAFENHFNHLSIKEDAPMNDILLNNMERINAVAEILLDLLHDNPRAQVLTEIIIETSRTAF